MEEGGWGIWGTEHNESQKPARQKATGIRGRRQEAGYQQQDTYCHMGFIVSRDWSALRGESFHGQQSIRIRENKRSW